MARWPSLRAARACAICSSCSFGSPAASSISGTIFTALSSTSFGSMASPPAMPRARATQPETTLGPAVSNLIAVMNDRSAAASKYLGPVGLRELLHALLLRDERLGLPHSTARSVDHAAVHLGKFTGGASRGRAAAMSFSLCLASLMVFSLVLASFSAW
jgi:hypothetical protein